MIEIFEEPWVQPRQVYFDRLLQRIVGLNGRKLVLLDPDTGIAPTNTKMEHVTVHEISRVWRALRKGDWLLVYQHKWRIAGWKEEAQQKFEDACDGAPAIICEGPDIASDVILLAARV